MRGVDKVAREVLSSTDGADLHLAGRFMGKGLKGKAILCRMKRVAKVVGTRRSGLGD